MNVSWSFSFGFDSLKQKQFAQQFQNLNLTICQLVILVILIILIISDKLYSLLAVQPIANMGNAQILNKPISNSKFKKYQTGSDFMLLHIDILSQTNDLSPWLALKQHRKQIYSHPLNLDTELAKVIHDGVCNDRCTALFKTDLYQDSIYDEIKKRKSIGNFYTHQQVWFMLLMIAKLAYSIYQNGPKWIIGNVHPKNILINENGEVKIITLNSLPYQHDHYQVYKKEGLNSAYISPQLIGFTQNSHAEYIKFPNCVSKQISQVFTIGMSMLSICLLETNLNDIYNKNEVNGEEGREKMGISKKSTIHLMHSFQNLINTKLLQTYINQIRSSYSNLLATIIEAMLNPNPQKRLSLFELYLQVLQPQEGYILGMEIDWLGHSSFTNVSYDPEETQKQHYPQRTNSYFY